MQGVSIPWPMIWGLLSATFVLGGLAVLLRGLYPKPIGMAPHCPKCGYNLTGSASPICPECGAPRRETACRRCGRDFANDASEVCPHCGGPRVLDTAVYGEYRRSRALIVAAGILVLVGLTSAGVLYRSIPRATARVVWPMHAPTISGEVHNAKSILASLRLEFLAGRTDPTTPGPSGKDIPPSMDRMGFLARLIQERIPYTIRKRGRYSPAVTAAAMAQAGAAGQFIQEQLVPAYKQARQSGKPEDAKALVPLVDQLDKQLDALLKTVKGY